MCEGWCMATASNEELAMRIEQLVREHIAATRLAAQEAVERAFGAAKAPQAKSRRPSSANPSALRAPRTAGEASALGERLYAAVCANPGVGMAALAKEVGFSVRQLSRPMMRLKRAGRVRSVGERNLTRYFPLVAGRSASA